ncbi:MAG TPA: SH3 domain-containing protein [Chitinophagales bacterium]|nr:SH3 domain-containing protein [Chitinophagales bacterium]HQW79556.1 SH3 domain-containing protein [Chitinophagales bacterium]
MIKTVFASLLLLTISIVSAQTNEQYIVSSQTLNMRSGAGKQYEVITTLSQGDAVTLIEKSDNGWWYVDFEGTEGYVFSQLLKKDPYSGWKKTNYESGVTPECENVNPQYDFKLDNYLRINVGSGTDVVVKLMKKGYYGDECIRIVYVRSRDTYEIKNVPEGRYYLKIAYGKDYRQKIVDNQCYVKFMQNAQYEKGIEILDFNKIKQPNQRIGNEIYENWSVPSFELSLDVIVTKGTKPTFRSNDISEAEFNQ